MCIRDSLVTDNVTAARSREWAQHFSKMLLVDFSRGRGRPRQHIIATVLDATGYLSVKSTPLNYLAHARNLPSSIHCSFADKIIPTRLWTEHWSVLLTIIFFLWNQENRHRKAIIFLIVYMTVVDLLQKSLTGSQHLITCNICMLAVSIILCEIAIA